MHFHKRCEIYGQIVWKTESLFWFKNNGENWGFIDTEELLLIYCKLRCVKNWVVVKRKFCNFA